MFGLPYQDKNSSAPDYSTHLKGFLDDDIFVPLKIASRSFHVSETNDRYIVEADMPGVKKEDITLRYDNQYLIISAASNEAQELKDESGVRKERRYGQFQMSLYVDNVIKYKIDAKFNEGVLTVALPKWDKGQNRSENIQIH